MLQYYFDYIDVPQNQKSVELFLYLQKQSLNIGGQIIKKRNLIIYEFKKDKIQSLDHLRYDLKQNKRELNNNQKLNITIALCLKYIELYKQDWPNWDLKNQKSILLIKDEQSLSIIDALELNQFDVIFISSNFLKQTQFDFKEEILVLYKLLCEFADSEIRKILEQSLLFSKDPINQLEQSIKNIFTQQKEKNRNWHPLSHNSRDNHKQIQIEESKHTLYQLIEQEVYSKPEFIKQKIKILNQNFENIRQLSLQIRINLLKHYQLDKKNVNEQEQDYNKQEIDINECDNEEALLQKANHIFGQPELYQLQDLFLEYAVRNQYQDHLEFLEDNNLTYLIDEVKARFLKDQSLLYSTNYAKYLSNQLQINS